MAYPGRTRIAALLIPALLAGGCTTNGATGTSGTAPGDGSGAAHADKGDAAKARKELDNLRTRVPDPMAGYSRDRFGPAWKDVDHNGCDTRNDILARDLVHVKKRGRCVVIAGELHDPYTGKDIAFAKAKAYQVQIDHIVPLALAWRMGADEWTAARRTELANDRDNLLAVWSRPNEQKGDKGPAEWRPRKDFQCTYAVKFVNVAYEFRLGVTRADRAALNDMLDTC